jgi:hypothetical protein
LAFFELGHVFDSPVVLWVGVQALPHGQGKVGLGGSSLVGKSVIRARAIGDRVGVGWDHSHVSRSALCR